MKLNKITNKEEQYSRICDYVASKDGKVLSTYKGMHIPMQFYCNKCDFEFGARPGNVLNGNWCRKCAGKFTAKEQMEILEKIVKQYNGSIVSKTYDPYNKMQFMCDKHGIIKMKAQAIRNGSWCKVCSFKKTAKTLTKSTNEIKTEAKKIKWMLISDNYNGARYYHEWECPKGHKVNMIWKRIQRDPNDCPDCNKINRNKAKNNRWSARLEELKKIATDRGGKCLSTHFRGDSEKLEWECGCGNKWKALATSVSRGSWCPNCNLGLGERLVRTALEQIYKCKFKQSSPGWLINPKTKAKLRLDGYNEKLKIAFEHQGLQHFKKNEKWHHKKAGAFEGQVYRDKLKLDLAKKNHISILYFEEIPLKLSLTNFKEALKAQLLKNKLPIPKSLSTTKINWKKAYVPVLAKKLKFFHDHAKKMNGVCLAKEFIGNREKYDFVCEKKHHFKMTGAKVRLGRWCRKCAVIRNSNKQRYTIEYFHGLAKNKKGICKSLEYQNQDSRLTFNCLKGHRDWTTSGASICAGSWCPACGHEKVWRIRKQKN